MKKLSELPMDAMICVHDIENLMTKKEYLEGNYNGWVYETEVEIATFDLKRCIEMVEDEMYYDWEEDVYNALKDKPEIQKAIETINQAFKDHPTYYKAALIIDDMIKGRKKHGENR